MPKPSDKPQIDKFRDAARELKTDQSDAAFEAVVNKIAHAPKLTNEQIKELVRRKREADKKKPA
ncbi:hypothetical protein FJ942_09730 [Mesorhizobium sp. B2-4-2]|uniref:hypothetical protein n=1 Tax=unclassified Mesorhizobium TaxID=325217 RepID=UPI00112A9AD9|nr:MULTISPECIES: hypothetical protein [unclassified Mesorhizobium]MBZ9956727.1 hypothetical protein [Mesorhizobium sp. BR1-1-14]TPL58933.1 hypothetical protein FJ942_09730 [Mesorhizobium sp. B2-4-2]